MNLLTAAPCALLGFLLGAIPTGVLIARRLHGIEPHLQGSTHTGGLNVYRTTGDFRAAAITGLADLCLGALAVWLARSLCQDPWAPPLAGVAAIWGHNYSPFVGWRGGVGISTIAGAMLVLSPSAALMGMLVLGVLWLLLRRVLRHDARSTVVVLLALPVLMHALGKTPLIVAMSGFGAVPIVLKELGDFWRVYPEAA